MAIVDTPRMSVWEALAGRAPGQPLGPADPGLWAAVAERVNPAKAKPCLRPGIEESRLVSVRGVEYVMLRSPDDRAGACYLRLAPEELELAWLMDGTRTLARLVAEFARITGRLAPDQVRRVVADLAGNRMLEELPLDAFSRLSRVRRDPLPLRFGRGLLAFAQGRRMVLANVDGLVSFLYKAGGKLLFTRVAAALMASLALVGLVAFVWQWWAGEQSVFLTGDSYVTGALVLLGLNVFALACHELGHALATKHSGRRVPAAGFLVYFGIPSVFVDTTDVWMAGRRGRLITTAAGPATGLILAGTSALVGFVSPELAPWCFKLSFAWYLNALFNLNPFLALDGYYLLMDWLELPNLRARGLAWVGARLRRRPPRFKALDREGRLVALYGILALVWVVIAINIAYRIYVDRVSGLVLGLWRSGWEAQLLLVVMVAALASPVVYILIGWLAKRGRRAKAKRVEKKSEIDIPRRLAALRASNLRELSPEQLGQLANRAHWVHPTTGEQLVFAGAAQQQVFTVVEGALVARAPDDPAGTVRERVGPGGVVGLACALSGAPSALAWYAAGTKLLAVPASTVATVVGPSLPVTPGANAAEVEALLAQTPAFVGVSYEDRLGLAAVAQADMLAPGAPVELLGAEDAVLIASGVVVLDDGTELGRGTLIGPAGEVLDGPVAYARTPVRSFILPAVRGLPLLLGASPESVAAADAATPQRAPQLGVHPVMDYPPLAAPPGPPPTNVDGRVDGRFEKRLRWLVLLFLLLAVFITGANVLPPLAWAEMPSDRALLSVESGTAVATVDGQWVDLGKGDDIYVRRDDTVQVGARSRATLTYRGGSGSVLCAQSQVAIGRLVTSGEPPQPAAALRVDSGIVLTDTGSATRAFHPLRASQESAVGTLTNTGRAWFAHAPWGVLVSSGTVTLNGVEVPASSVQLDCGDGEPIPRPSGGEGTDPTTAPTDPTATETTPWVVTTPPSPGATPTLVPATTPGPTTPGVVTTGPQVTTAGPPRTTPPRTTPPRTTPPRTTPPRTTPPVTTGPPRDTVGPTVRVIVEPGLMNPAECPFFRTVDVQITAVDQTDKQGTLDVYYYYTLNGQTSGRSTAKYSSGNVYVGGIGPIEIALRQATTMTVWAGASDAAGNDATEVSAIVQFEAQCIPG